jgi:tyrosine-protein kinase Etk/Wzc
VAETASEQGVAGTRSSAPPPVSAAWVAAVLLRRRAMVVAAGVALATVVGTVWLLLPRRYTTVATFMPQARRPAGSSAAVGLAAQFGLSLAGGEGAGSPQFYADLVLSRSVMDSVAASRYAQPAGAGDSMPLAAVLGTLADDAAVQLARTTEELRKLVRVGVNLRTDVVTVRVTTRWPELSAQIAERILGRVAAFNLHVRQSQAGAERQFAEARLAEVRRDLREAEDARREFLQRNLDYRTSPMLALEEERLGREVTTRQQIYLSLAQALEQSKMEEVRDTPVLTVVDPPVAPVLPDRRGLIVKVSLAGLIGVGLGALAALLVELVQRWRREGDADVREFLAAAGAAAAPLRRLAGRPGD